MGEPKFADQVTEVLAGGALEVLRDARSDIPTSAPPSDILTLPAWLLKTYSRTRSTTAAAWPSSWA